MAKKIIVYSTPTCPHCRKAQQFLKDNSIEFVNIYVSVDNQKAQERIDRSGQMGVPVIDIDGDMIVGFDQSRIKAALGI